MTNQFHLTFFLVTLVSYVLLEQGVQPTDNPGSPKVQKNVEVKELAPVPSMSSSRIVFCVFWK
jgi:hypothetical protein